MVAQQATYFEPRVIKRPPFHVQSIADGSPLRCFRGYQGSDLEDGGRQQEDDFWMHFDFFSTIMDEFEIS